MQLHVFKSAIHLDAAKPVLNKIVVIMGILSGLSIIGGILGILWNTISPTEFDLFGAKLSTGHIGVAFTALGLICMVLVVRSVLKFTHKLAALQENKNN